MKEKPKPVMVQPEAGPARFEATPPTPQVVAALNRAVDRTWGAF